MNKYDLVIRLLKEILYILESDYLPSFIQLDKTEGSMINQINQVIKMLELGGRL